MTSMTMQQAFDAYLGVEHRLPVASRQGACTPANNLDDIADRFDVFLLDAFGVLNIGETAIPGAPERIADLQQAGKTVIVVSNASSVPAADLQQKYRRLGFEFELSRIVTSRSAIRALEPHAAALRDTPFATVGAASAELLLALGCTTDVLSESRGLR